MRPVLFSVFGFDIQSYGVSKALAALVAASLPGRVFERLGLKRDSAYSLVMWATIWGFVGAKVYYLLEQLPTLTMHDLGGMGFTADSSAASLPLWSSCAATGSRSAW